MEGMLMWNAQYASKEVDHILEEELKGSVHSVFNRSFNLVFGNRLIHIGAKENGMAPFSIGIDQLDAQMLIRKIKPGQTVVWNARSKALHFLSGDVLSLQSVVITDHFLPTLPFHRQSLERNFLYLIEKLSADEWQTGIVETNVEKKMILEFLAAHSCIPAEHPVIKSFQRLQAFVSGEKQAARPVFDYWIGRGTGLTPSGDDILTGLCAAFAALKQQNDLNWIENLASYMNQYGGERTTAVSVAYLTYAAKREFHSHLIQVMESLVQPDGRQLPATLDEMKKMGHTSGTDTLIGVLTGVGAVLYSNPD